MKDRDEPIIHTKDEQIILHNRKQAIHYVQDQMANYSVNGRQLSEEIIIERRKEAEIE